MKKSFVVFLTALLLAPCKAFAIDTANLEFAVAVPNPITAGDIVNFQAVGVNSGSEEWLASEYYWEAEVYDTDKKYIGKTERVMGDTNITPGNASAVTLSFNIPPNFGGFYYFRAYLVHGQTRLVESVYTLFRVIERPIQITPPPPKSAVGGSFLTSYQTPNLDDGRAGQASTVLNLVGKAGEGTYLLNSYNLHDSTSPWNPYIILGSYFNPKGSVSLGDVSPVFSPLSLGGQGIRGLEMTVTPTGGFWQSTQWQAAAGRTVSALTAGANSNGRYERLVYGFKGALELAEGKIKVAPNIVAGTDNTASLSIDPKSSEFRGATLRPQSNLVNALSMSVLPLTGLEMILDLAQSKFTANTEAPRPLSGSAVNFQTAYSMSGMNLRGSVQRASSDFTAFGAPQIASDRMTYNALAGLQPLTWAGLGLSYTQFSDNLADDPRKTTSVQRVYSASPSFSFPTQTRLSGSWSKNTAQAVPLTTLNNVSQTVSAGISQGWRSQMISISAQNTEFKDLNRVAHDLDTNTLSIALSLALGSRIRLYAGNTASQTKDIFDGHKRDSIAQSGSIHVGIIPGKLSGQIWGSLIGTKDNGSTTRADNKSSNGNAELTWQVKQDIAFTVGGSQTSRRDTVLKTRSDLTGVSTRVSINF